MKLINKVRTWWSNLAVATVNRTFSVIIFIVVFLFTFLFGFEFKEKWKLLLIIFGPLFGVVVIAWILIALIIYKRKLTNDKNKQKINKAIEKFEEENKNKTIDKINN